MDTESNNAETKQETSKPDLASIVKNLPNAPDQPTIDAWKAKYKDVFVSGFSEEEIFIWRSINRVEYKKFQIEQQAINALQQNTNSGSPQDVKAQVAVAIDTQYAMEENLVANCILWPKLTPEELSAKAGTIPSLLEQIMQNSNFMTPAQASVLVMRL